MHSIILVGIGGAIGAILRHLLGTWIQNGSQGFPYGTLSVNIIGSFLLSLIMFSSEHLSLFDENTRTFLTIGLLGAFTTLSTFSYEAFKFIEKGEMVMLTKYVLATIIFSLLAIYASRAIILGLIKIR